VGFVCFIPTSGGKKRRSIWEKGVRGPCPEKKSFIKKTKVVKNSACPELGGDGRKIEANKLFWERAPGGKKKKKAGPENIRVERKQRKRGKGLLFFFFVVFFFLGKKRNSFTGRKGFFGQVQKKGAGGKGKGRPSFSAVKGHTEGLILY